MRSRLIDALLLGPQRRRRAMRKKLAELDVIDMTQRRRGWGRGPRHSNGGSSTLVPVLLAVSLVAAGGAVMVNSAAGLNVTLGGVRVLGGSLSDGPYEFLATQPWSSEIPVSYSSCDPIHIVVNTDLQPDGADGLVEEAVQEVSELTGLELSLDGETTEESRAGAGRSLGQASLIVWSTPEKTPGLAGDVAGLGGSSATTDPVSGYVYYYAGTVTLDAPQLGDSLDGLAGRRVARATILHELGHLVGLDHVEDSSQLMYPKGSNVFDFQGGDRKGLEILGAGPCIN